MVSTAATTTTAAAAPCTGRVCQLGLGGSSGSGNPPGPDMTAPCASWVRARESSACAWLRETPSTAAISVTSSSCRSCSSIRSCSPALRPRTAERSSVRNSARSAPPVTSADSSLISGTRSSAEVAALAVSRSRRWHSYLAERRERPPQTGKLPAFASSRSDSPEGKSRDHRFCQRFFPGNFPAPRNPAHDQRSTWSSSSASLVMTASGSAASNAGTSEFEMSTARMPVLLAP